MKKVLILCFALLLCLSFVACSQDNANQNPVEKYVGENQEVLVDSLNEDLQSSGLTCDTTVEAKENGIVFTVKFQGINNLSDEDKALIQSSYDSMGSTFNLALKELQKELPELKSYSVNVCEEDGDLIAAIVAEG